jgi:AraC-like DNA-binding protein
MAYSQFIFLVMIYGIYSPVPELSFIIDCFIIIKNEGKGSSYSFRNFPDLHPKIIFQIGTGSNQCEFEIQNYLNADGSPLVMGIQTISSGIKFNDSSDYVIAKFKPFGLHFLFGINQYTLKNKVVRLQDVIEFEAGAFHQMITSPLDVDAKLESVEKLFVKILEKSRNIDIHTSSIIQTLTNTFGRVKLSEIQNDYCITARTLENRFKSQIGISPKEYCSLLRFKYFLSNLVDIKTSLTQLSYETGYYDQSHAIRCFKRIMGITPTEYLQNLSAFDVIKLGILSSDVVNSSIDNRIKRMTRNNQVL